MDKEKLTLLEEIQKYQFLILSFVAIGAGLFLLVSPEKFPVKVEICYNIGSALITTGIVSIALDWFTKKQFSKLIDNNFENAIEKSSLKSDINSINSLLQFGASFEELGVRKIHKTRKEIDLIGIIKKAEKGSQIRLLGVCLRGFIGADQQTVLLDKLKEGCKIDMLVINPNSQFVKQRGNEEDRKKKILERILWLQMTYIGIW